VSAESDKSESNSPVPETGGGRERILLEARGRFGANGYAAVTMQEIAERVGLTKAALYYHFGDKEGLFAEVFASEMTALAARISAVIAETPSLHERLERIAGILLESGHAEFGQLIVDFDRFLSDERRRSILRDVPSHLEAIRPAFTDAGNSGEIRTERLETMIGLYFAMVFGHIRSARLGRTQAVPADLARAIADLTLWGIAT
jgi:AcrR family transcriptional regulator